MKPKTLLVPVALFIYCSVTFLPATAQSLYEIKFTDRQNISYTGLLVFFNETNAYMRIAYNNKNIYNVVNVTYKMKNGVNRQGDKYSMLMGSNPVFITDNKAGLKYNPDYFIWFYNYSAGIWNNPLTTDDSLLSPSTYIHVNAYTKLDPLKITDEYLRRFFGDYEPQYFSLKKMCGLTPVTIKPVEWYNSASLHFVLVANTMDATIGTSCSTDQTNLKNEFRQIANALGVSFKEYITSGYDFSKEKMLTDLKTLKAGNNDIVVFIYRGHGFRWKNQDSDWPRLDLRNSAYATPSESNSVNLSEIYNTIVGKGARLNIILGDCCNSEINQSPVTGNNYLTFQVDNNSDVSKLRRLFMDSKGTILSAAARKGEVSWASLQGGLYSISFLQSLREEISYLNSGVSNWDNVLTKTISLARIKSTTQFCSNCTLQNGIKYVSVTHY